MMEECYNIREIYTTTIGTVSEHLDTQEEVDWAQVSKLEVLLEFRFHPSNLCRVAAGDGDIVHIRRCNDTSAALLIQIDKDAAVRLDLLESQLTHDLGKLLMPLTRRLLQPIDSLDQGKHPITVVLRAICWEEIRSNLPQAVKDLHGDVLFKVTIEESR